jgi:hypothetical protein
MSWWSGVTDGYKKAGAFGALGGAVGLGGEVPDVIGGMTSDRTNNQWRDPNQANFNLPGFDQRNSQYQQGINGAQGRSAFQAGENGQFRGDQSQLAQMLMGAAHGDNSVSQEQLRQAQMQNVGQQQAMAASAAPGQQAMATRQAMANAARMGYGMAGQASLAGLQERQGAMSQLGNVLQGARGQDQQMSQFNTAQQAQNRGQNDQYGLGLMGLQQQNAQAQQQGGMGYEQARTQRFAGALGQPTQQEQIMGLISGAAGMAGMPK